MFKQESQNLVVAGGGGALLADDNLFHGINSFLLDCLYYSTGWRESQDPLQGLAFGNEVFCLVEVQQPLNRLAFFLRGAIDIK